LPPVLDENENSNIPIKHEESQNPKLISTSVNLNLAILDLPSNITDNFRSHQPILAGDIILTEFRRTLERESISTEFINGTLVCNDTVTLRKVKDTYIYNIPHNIFDLSNQI
jgi:hypothetical protein